MLSIPGRRYLKVRNSKNFSSSLQNFIRGFNEDSYEPPVFEVPTSNIWILKDPIDFYAALNSGVTNSNSRVCMSSLYWGKGIFEESIIRRLQLNMQRNPSLRLRMLHDETRTRRRSLDKGSFISSVGLLDSLKSQTIASDVIIGLLSVHDKPSMNPIIDEIKGVHHCKFAVFDNSVILTGANFEEQYFFNRRDRYWLLNNCPEVADYLEDYLMTQLNYCNMLDGLAEFNKFIVRKGMGSKYERAKKMNQAFNYTTYMNQLRGGYNASSLPQIAPNEKLLQLETDIKDDKPHQTQDQENEENKEGEYLYSFQKDIKSNILELLSGVKNIEEISRVMNQIDFEGFDMDSDFDDIDDELEDDNNDDGANNSKNSVKDEEVAYFIPMPQFQKAMVNHDYNFMQKLLEASVEDPKIIKNLHLVSGYLNIPSEFVSLLQQSQLQNMTLIGARPEANSFYGAKGIKKQVPFFYQRRLLEYTQKFGENTQVLQSHKPGWTFHSKMLLADSAEGDYLISIGSSNFSQRSYARDHELNFYMYSTSSKFRKVIKKEVDLIKSESQPFDTNSVKKRYKSYFLDPILKRMKLF